MRFALGLLLVAAAALTSLGCTSTHASGAVDRNADGVTLAIDPVLDSHMEVQVRPQPPAENAQDATNVVEKMRADVNELEESAEVPDLRVKVSHILIKVATDPSGEVTPEALQAAEKECADIYARVRAGEDFDALATEFSEDGEPGKPKNSYAMWQKVSPPVGEYWRDSMIAAFGNVGWKLKVGEVGVAPFDKNKSPYGWHIIKRIE